MAEFTLIFNFNLQEGDLSVFVGFLMMFLGFLDFSLFLSYCLGHWLWSRYLCWVMFWCSNLDYWCCNLGWSSWCNWSCLFGWYSLSSWSSLFNWLLNYWFHWCCLFNWSSWCFWRYFLSFLFSFHLWFNWKIVDFTHKVGFLSSFGLNKGSTKLLWCWWLNPHLFSCLLLSYSWFHGSDFWLLHMC